MRPKVLSIQETKYPLDYDMNNRSGFESWKKYIHTELSNHISPGEMLLVELSKIITKMPEKRAITNKEKFSGDKIIYVMLFVAAVTLAIVSSY